jgi:tetratricopeptide (TPR) repeat protein
MEPETIEDVLALIRERPADAELFQQLGRLYTKAGRVEDARQAYERSLELDPNDPFTHLYLGNWFYARQMYPEALARFQQAAEIAPREAVAYSCQGDVYRAQGRHELAQEAYEKAVRLAPDNERSREKLAALHEDQRRSRAREAFRKDQPATTVLLASRWLRGHPDDLWVIHDYATMLYRMARYDEAIRVYLDAIERFEEWRWGTYNQLGHLYDYRGGLAQAELWYQKAIDERPDEATSYIFLGAVQARQGKLRQAEETHRRATQCREGQTDEAFLNLGLVLRGQGRLGEAAECFRKAIELCPKYPEAVEALQDVEAALALSTDDEE